MLDLTHATLSYFLRATGTTSEKSVCVRHYCKTKDTEFVRTTGVKVADEYFDHETGKVSGRLTQAPEWDAKIQRVYTDIATASRNLRGKGIRPTKAVMGTEYDRLLAERARHEELMPAARRLVVKRLNLLKMELDDLLAEVEAKRKEIQEEELAQGIYVNLLLTHYIKEYWQSKEATAAANTVRLFKSLGRVIESYNPTWRVDEVTPETLAAFEKWHIKAGKKNLTITSNVTKVKTVVYAFAKRLNLDVTELRTHKTEVKKKRNPFVPFLTQEELKDLMDLELTNEVEKKVRDRFVLMSLTGVRFSDSVITPDNIVNSELLFTTVKTDTDLVIPMSKTVTELLARYDNNIPAYQSQYFNKIIKVVCAKVERLNYKIPKKTYLGKNKPERTYVVKHTAISAHAGRRTFINLALLKGISPVAIAAVVGHEGVELIMKTYGSAEVGRERFVELMDAA
jgi:Phage integrase SAM-like domain